MTNIEKQKLTQLRSFMAGYRGGCLKHDTSIDKNFIEVFRKGQLATLDSIEDFLNDIGFMPRKLQEEKGE
jgi:hypothetical protein